LTLGNDTIGNGWKSVARNLIDNGIFRVARFRHFIYYSAENRCLFIFNHGFIGVGDI
jgi:hypothetical protein